MQEIAAWAPSGCACISLDVFASLTPAVSRYVVPGQVRACPDVEGVFDASFYRLSRSQAVPGWRHHGRRQCRTGLDAH